MNDLMKDLIEIENSGYCHRIEYIFDSDSGVAKRQIYSYFKNGEIVWSKEFQAGVSFGEMAKEFISSGLYVKTEKVQK